MVSHRLVAHWRSLGYLDLCVVSLLVLDVEHATYSKCVHHSQRLIVVIVIVIDIVVVIVVIVVVMVILVILVNVIIDVVIIIAGS